MKKGLKIALIIFISIILVLIIGLSIFMSIKGNKKPIDADRFTEITSELGYDTSKVTTSSTVIDSYRAKKADYEINFYVTSNELAKKNFDRIKLEYENNKDSSSIETSVSIGNYAKYSLSTNGYYMIVTKIDNTVMFTKVSEQYKNIIKDAFDKLGY